MIKEYNLDLGSSKIRLLHKKKTVFEESSIVRIDLPTKQVTHYGNDVLSERESSSCKILPVINHGEIKNSIIFSSYLKYMFKKIDSNMNLSKIRISLGNMSNLSNKVAVNSLNEIQVDEVIFTDIGRSMYTGLYKLTKIFLLEIGGGLSKFKIIENGKIKALYKLNLGGIDLSKSIENFLQNEYQINKDFNYAEKVKFKIADSIRNDDLFIEIIDRSIESGTYKIQKLYSYDLYRIVSGFNLKLSNFVKKSIEKLSQDDFELLVEQGIVLIGDGSQLRNIEVYLSKSLGVGVYRYN